MFLKLDYASKSINIIEGKQRPLLLCKALINQNLIDNKHFGVKLQMMLSTIFSPHNAINKWENNLASEIYTKHKLHTGYLNQANKLHKGNSYNCTIYDLKMVYTIKFNHDKPPIYNQAINSNANEAKEIQKNKVEITSKSIRKQCCAITASLFLGVIIAFVFIGRFKRI